MIRVLTNMVDASIVGADVAVIAVGIVQTLNAVARLRVADSVRATVERGVLTLVVGKANIDRTGIVVLTLTARQAFPTDVVVLLAVVCVARGRPALTRSVVAYLSAVAEHSVITVGIVLALGTTAIHTRNFQPAAAFNAVEATDADQV